MAPSSNRLGLVHGRKDKDLAKVPSKLNLPHPKRKAKRKKVSVKNGHGPECSEAAVAQRLLALSIREDYDKYGPEHEAKLMLRSQQMEKKAKKDKLFDPIPTLQEFEEEENRKDRIVEAEGSLYFQMKYPVMGHTLPREIYESPIATTSPKSPLGDCIFGTSLNDTDGFNQTRPHSSPIRRPGTFTNGLRSKSPTRANDDSGLSGDSLAHVPSLYVKEDVAHKAEDLWGVLLDDLWVAGHQIEYSDVTHLASSWLNATHTQHAVQYVCALLGLRTAMHELRKVAERGVFNQILSLIKFFRETNPLTVPVRRVKKARAIYQNHISNHQESVNSPRNGKFIRWIVSMQRTLDFVLHAHVHRSILENDALISQQSALLKVERMNTKKRAAEIATICQTAAAKAATDGAVSKRKSKNGKKYPQPRCDKSDWWETTRPLGDTFQLTLNTDDVDGEREYSNAAALEVNAKLLVNDIINTCTETILSRYQD